MTESMVEKVARVFCDLDGGPPFDERPDDKKARRKTGFPYVSRDEARDAAVVLLLTVAHAGFVIRPRVPTLEMLLAGQTKIRTREGPSMLGPHEYASREEMAEAWEAMIDAWGDK